VREVRATTGEGVGQERPVVRSRTLTVDDETLARLCAPRDDIVGERAVPEPPAGETRTTDRAERPDGTATGDTGAGNEDDTAPGRRAIHRFEQADGPFVSYARRVEILGSDATAADGRDGDGDHHVVRQTVEVALPRGTWRFLLHRVVTHTLLRPARPGRMPWWAPPQRPDPRAATVLGLLAALAMVVAYHGTVLGQTMTFAADEFDVSKTAQSVALSAARIGGVLAIVLTALGDRVGRRHMVLVSLLVCIGSTALGAVTPNLFGLAATQVINRGGWAASFILLGILLAEEMPAGARAYAISVVSLTGALGAGMALWVLPIADLGDRAWRVLYALPLLMIPVVIHCWRHLPESRRYERPHRKLSLGDHRSRLWLLAIATLLLSIFLAPQTQLRNDFLNDERGFSAGAISLFVLVVSTPAGIGVVAGGRLADTAGRRVVGAFSVAVGTALMAASFMVASVPMWLLATLGSVVFAAHIPALAVYGPELFPTSLRGRANGVISITGMGGSVIGLLAAGVMADAFDSYGPTMAIVAIGPLLMAVLILLRFPETARRELEDINPDDLELDPDVRDLEDQAPDTRTSWPGTTLPG
jgi:MFS family permease